MVRGSLHLELLRDLLRNVNAINGEAIVKAHAALLEVGLVLNPPVGIGRHYAPTVVRSAVARKASEVSYALMVCSFVCE